MSATTDAIQKLYVAYFNRPADPLGLAYWSPIVDAAKGDTSAVSKAFAASDEYTATFKGMTQLQIVNTVYNNLFGHGPDAAGALFWANAMLTGKLTVDNVVTGIAAGAQGTDLVAYQSKVSAAAAFTAAVDTGPELIGYQGTVANNAAKAWLSSVVDATTLANAIVPATLDAAVANVINAGANSSGQTFTMTTSIDNLVGTAGGDTFNANVTATSNPLGSLDVVDGGAGNDTLNIADTATAAAAQFSLPMGLTITNVETYNVSTNGGVNMDVSGQVGLTKFVAASAGTAGNTIVANSGVDVTSTVTGAAVTSITSGKNDVVNAGTGAVSVGGSKISSVTVNGGNLSGANAVTGSANAIDNTTGKTLTAVTLNGVDSAANIHGDAMTTLTLSGATSVMQTTTISNATANHGLTINAAGTGYSAAGSKLYSKVTDATATSVTVNTTAKSAVDISGDTAAKSVTLTGSGSLDLASLTGTAVTSIDGSAATGNLTLNTLIAGITSIKTGAGADKFTETSTAKFTLDAGAGNDIVTLGADVQAGSTITLGAGNDSLLQGGTSVVQASTSTATTVIDGGDGTDVVAAALINAANAAQFKNFEGLDLSGASNLDVQLMTGSAITTLALNGRTAAVTGGVTNVAAGVGLTVAGDNHLGLTSISLADASGSSDSFTVTFAGSTTATSTPSTPNVLAGQVQIDGIENVNVASAGTGNVHNSIVLTDNKMKTVTITGSKDIDVSFLGTNGTNGSSHSGGVNLIDGSAATGKLNINTANTTEDLVTGLTVKGGSANDSITLAHFAFVNAGAGNDTIVASAEGDVLTGGAGTDTFDLHLAVGGGTTAATSAITEITDFAAGDMIVGATSFSATKVALDTSVTNLDAAFALALSGSAAGNATWFTYGSSTYMVISDGVAGLTANDIIVKLDGVTDLSHATIASGVLTMA